MTRTRPVTGMFAAALVLALAAPAAAQSSGFLFEGRECVESVAVLAVPAENVEPHVPDGYEVQTPATLGVGVLRCAAATVDGSQAGRLIVSDVGVGIEQPGSCTGACGGSHFYQLWQLTDSHLLRARVSGLGIAGAFVAGMSMATGPLPGPMQATATVPWTAGWYGLSTLTAPPAPADEISNTPNWWHETRHGAARIRYSFPGTTGVGVGRGTVEATSGPLAALIGDGPSHGAGLFITMSQVRGEARRG